MDKDEAEMIAAHYGKWIGELRRDRDATPPHLIEWRNMLSRQIVRAQNMVRKAREEMRND